MRYLVTFLLVGYLYGCEEYGLSCDKTHPAAERARKIASDRLEKLYEQVESLGLSGGGLPLRYQEGHDKYPVPKEFADLNVKFIDLLKDDVVRLNLASCVHAGIRLEVHNNTVASNIQLAWTDGDNQDKSEILWQKND